MSKAKDDGLELYHCRITNAVKCLPPQNKPLPAEVKICNSYLSQEIATLKSGAVILALGSIAHAAVLQSVGLKASAYKFGHGHEHQLPDHRWLLDSYHCSRYNTQTKRLTAAMFKQIFARAKELMAMV